MGKIIVQQLRAAGLEVDNIPPDQVQSLDGYQAVVLGSSVYLTKWLEGANKFVSRFERTLRHLPVWTFSVGLAGVPADQVQDPGRVGPVLLKIQPKEAITFAGRLDTTQLSLRERSIARLGGAVEGDYLDPQKIATWGQKIARELSGQSA